MWQWNSPEKKSKKCAKTVVFWATGRPARRPGGRQDAPSHGGWKDANIVRWWSNVVRTRTSTRKGTLNCDIESGVFHLSVCLYALKHIVKLDGQDRLYQIIRIKEAKFGLPFIGAPACAVLMLNRLAENQSRSHNHTSTATNHNCLGLVMWQVLNVANCWNYTPWKEKLPTMATRVNWGLLCPSKEATGFFQVSSKAAVLFTSLETSHHYSPENNMSPETSWLEDYFQYWNGPFLGNIRSFRPHLATHDHTIPMPRQGFSVTECRCSPSLSGCTSFDFNPREVDSFDTECRNPPPRMYKIITPGLVNKYQPKQPEVGTLEFSSNFLSQKNVNSFWEVSKKSWNHHLLEETHHLPSRNMFF